MYLKIKKSEYNSIKPIKTNKKVPKLKFDGTSSCILTCFL